MPHTLRLASLALLVLIPCAPLVSQTDDKPTPKDKLATDIDKPASPPRPTPEWVKLVDLGKQDKRLAGNRAPEGVKVEIVAEAPTVINPVGLAFTDEGTPLVIEWPHDPNDKPKIAEETFKFKDGKTHKVAVVKKAKKDLIKALSSSKEGVWDKARVILEDELSSSVLPLDGWLYVAGRGSVRRYKQSKEGGAYDKMEVIAKGFGGFAQHQVSGLTLGPDGLLYISAGDGDNIVEGSDGSGATVLRSGAIFRCRPDGAKLETFAIGFRNPYRGVSFDLRGQMFHLDNDGAGPARFTGCRLLHISEGSDFGWRMALDERKPSMAPANAKPDPVRAAAFGEKPGKLPGLIKTGKGSPAGLLIYDDTLFPEDFQNILIYPDVARRLVRAYRTETYGASYKVTEEFELLSAPKDELFRPCQAVLGPDGAIYIVDWRTNSTGGGRLLGDGKNGRIYRLSWGGVTDVPAIPLRPMDSWAKIAKLKDEELIKALSGVDASQREHARRELVRRGDKNRPALIKLLKNADARVVAKMNALGVLRWVYDDDVQKAVLAALADGDDELKRVAAEALGMHAAKDNQAVQDGLVKALSEDDNAVRRAVLMALGRLGCPAAPDSLATALSFDNGRDRFLTDGIISAIETLGKDGITGLMTLADSGVQADTDKVVNAFLTMRSRAAFAALPALLKHMHVSHMQRAELIRSCTNYQFEPPVSMDAIIAVVAKNAKETSEVRKALLEVLSTPGVTAGKAAEDWAKAMQEDKDEEVSKAARAYLKRGAK